MQSILLRYLCSKMVGQQFTPEQRTFMVLAYHQSGSPSQRRQAFVERFPNRRPPDKRTIVRNFQKYQRHATSRNRNKGKSGRPKVARSQQNVDAVRAELTANPEASTRRNNLPHLTKSSFNRISPIPNDHSASVISWRPSVTYQFLQLVSGAPSKIL
jgi:hypothetical protein